MISISLVLSFSVTRLLISHQTLGARVCTQYGTYIHTCILFWSCLFDCVVYWLMFSCNQVYYCEYYTNIHIHILYLFLVLCCVVFFFLLSTTFEIHISGVWLLYGSFIPPFLQNSKLHTHTVRFLLFLLLVDDSLRFTWSNCTGKGVFPLRYTEGKFWMLVWFCALFFWRRKKINWIIK